MRREKLLNSFELVVSPSELNSSIIFLYSFFHCCHDIWTSLRYHSGFLPNNRTDVLALGWKLFSLLQLSVALIMIVKCLFWGQSCCFNTSVMEAAATSRQMRPWRVRSPGRPEQNRAVSDGSWDGSQHKLHSKTGWKGGRDHLCSFFIKSINLHKDTVWIWTCFYERDKNIWNIKPLKQINK